MTRVVLKLTGLATAVAACGAFWLLVLRLALTANP